MPPYTMFGPKPSPTPDPENMPPEVNRQTIDTARKAKKTVRIVLRDKNGNNGEAIDVSHGDIFAIYEKEIKIRERKKSAGISAPPHIRTIKLDDIKHTGIVETV